MTRHGSNYLRMVCIGTLALASAACDYEQTTELVDVTVREVNDQAGGEEPYFAVIKFRTTFGVPGSTSVEFLPERATLAVPTVYPWMGAVPIPSAKIAQLTRDSFVPVDSVSVVSNGMTLMGRVIVGLEEDDRGWNPAFGVTGVRDTLYQLADELEDDLRLAESLPWSPALMSVVQDSIESLIQTYPRSLPRQGATDDLIGVHIVLNVGAVGPYYDQMRGLWDAMGIAPCEGNYPLTPPQSGLATYILSVCPAVGEQTMTLPYDAGPGHTTYDLRIHQQSGATG